MKRPIILAKKEDKSHADESGTKILQDKPKILLKPKEKENALASHPAPVQISIATRPVDISAEQKIHSHKLNIESTQKEAKEHVIGHSNIDQFLNASHSVPVMKKPMPIISDHYQIVGQTLDYLVETNTDFFVVGVIGTLGSGKSTIMNILCESDNANSNTDSTKDQLWFEQNEIFKTRSSKEFIFSNMPATEGIQMYVKRDRTILLDCSPLLCNPYKKDCILNEIDDLKMIIFLLSVCHVLIVVDDSGFNVNLFRFIQCAEKMKLDLYEKDYVSCYSPHILFFKNYCSNKNFLPTYKEKMNLLHREFFKDSKLRISSLGYSDYAGGAGGRLKIPNVNIFYFPFIDRKSNINILLNANFILLIF